MQQLEPEVGVDASDAMTKAVQPEVPFAAWLSSAVATLEDDEPAEVPCGECNACCRTHHYIHVRPEEKRARARLPASVAVPGAGTAAGLPGDRAGRRRLLPAADRRPLHGLRGPAARLPHLRLPGVRGDRRRRRTGPTSRRRCGAGGSATRRRTTTSGRAAVLAAASFVREHPESMASDVARLQPIRVATLAVAVHALFLDDAVVGARRRPVGERDRTLAVADANERLFGDG